MPKTKDEMFCMRIQVPFFFLSLSLLYPWVAWWKSWWQFDGYGKWIHAWEGMKDGYRDAMHAWGFMYMRNNWNEMKVSQMDGEGDRWFNGYEKWVHA